MKTNQFVLGIMLASMGISLNSCQNREEFFSNNLKVDWEKQMGSPVAADQNWNMACDYSINVDVPMSSTIKIYAPMNGAYNLVGRYDNVEGIKELKFTAVKGLEEVVVSNGVKSQKVKVGGTFSDLETRATKHDIEVTQASDKGVADYQTVLEMLPEEIDNMDKPGLHFDFSFCFPDREGFTLYPIYSYTSTGCTIGIYFYDEQGKKVHVDLYNMDSSVKDGDIYAIQNHLPNGIHVSLPVGTEFGLYIGAHGRRFYSEKSENACGKSHVASFQANGVTYLGFDDWCYATSDLNDVVCYIEPDPEIHDNLPVRWAIACEDLGSVGDYDFNDVVFEVSHISGTTKATFVPLAAGGFLKSTVYRNGEEIGEIHSLLHAPVSSLINTSAITFHGDTLELDVPSDWSLAEDMGGFSIISESTGAAQVIKAPTLGSVPQMLLIPSDPVLWRWPLEKVNIQDAYPLFRDWNENAKNTDWINQIVVEKLIKR